MVSASAAVNGAWAGRGLGVQPLAGGRLPADVQDWRAAVARLGEVGEVLLATTVHEARAFVPPAAAAGLPDSVAEGFRAAHFAEPGDRPVSGSAWERMTADMTEHQFASAARELASELRAAGIGVHVSRLDVEAGVDGAGAAHCLDVPFLFGDRSRWLDAPMLRGMSEEAFDAVAAAWRDPLVRAVAGEAAATGPVRSAPSGSRTASCLRRCCPTRPAAAGPFGGPSPERGVHGRPDFDFTVLTLVMPVISLRA